MDIKSKAVKILNNGGVIIFPTETVYGIGADIKNKEAINKIYKIKKRDLNKPLSYHIGSLDQIDINSIDKKYKKLIDKFWPGPLTLIYYDKKYHDVIGVRYPSCPIFLKIAQAFGRPIAGTSVNFSNQGSIFSFRDINKEIIDQVDLAIDAGETEFKQESTILDISGGEPVVVREGAVSKEEILQFLL